MEGKIKMRKECCTLITSQMSFFKIPRPKAFGSFFVVLAHETGRQCSNRISYLSMFLQKKS